MKKVLSIILAVVMMATMSVSVFADIFVGSIEAKPAVEIIPAEENGQSFGAIVFDAESGETVIGVPVIDENGDSTILEFVVVSAAEKEQAKLGEIKENIENSMNQIKSVKNLGELTEGLGDKIEEALDKFYGDSAEKIGIGDLVVSDLFDVSLIKDKDHIEQVAEGQKARFTVKPNFTKNDFFVLLHNTDGTNWEVVTDVEWTDEGYLIITVDSMSVFAFAVERTEDLSVDPDGPDSPQTSNMNNYNFLYAGIALICVVAAVFFFVKSKDRKKAQ